jgi:hypothetical protein
MSTTLRKPRRANRPLLGWKQPLRVELLETRTVPSASWPGLSNPVAALGSNSTLDQAQSLGDLSAVTQLGVVGAIASGSAQVDWYTFTLDNPTHVTLATHDVQARSPFVSELSLYNADSDPTSDPYAPVGRRLVTQDDGASHGGDARIDWSLAPGTYYVAVSGSGNRYFHPDIAGSGIAGSTGAYGLSITGQDLGFTSANGPGVLATGLLTYPDFTPPASNLNGAAANAVVGRSPFVIRVDMSTALDPNTINPGSTLQLTDITTGQSIAVTAYFDATVNELKILPAAPLPPDQYQLTLSGNNSGGAPVIADLAGNPLGATSGNPAGQDYTFTFQITGSEGIASTSAVSDGTPASAHELGDITQTNLVQEVGAIGDDPSDPTPFNPADIDLYHFQLSGAGNFAFRAVVFGGRIGSLLDSEVSLFKLNPADGQLYLIGLNDNTNNGTRTFDGSQQPLVYDPSLTMALQAGDYYLAVTGSGYVPAALTNGLPGPQSVFDPTVPEPFGGFSTGDYVLNLSVLADNTPPQVTSVGLSDGSAPANGAVLSGPPTGFAVTFTEPVNLADQAQQAFQQNTDTKLPFVYVVGASGTFYPRLTDSTGNSVRFQMYDGLPNGVYDLHLSGPGGLTDLAGNPLVGNRTSGDYVVTFMVNGPPRGSPNDPLTWVVPDQRNIGILFPAELQKGVTLQRPSVTGSVTSIAASEAYQIQVLQPTRYSFLFSSTVLPPGLRLTISNAAGTTLPARSVRSGLGLTLTAVLAPGTYTIHVSGWSPKAGFSIKILIVSAFEPAPPLTVGAAPAVPLRGLTGVLPPPPGIVPVTPTPTPAGTPSVPKPSVIAVVSPPSGRGQDTNPVNVPADVLLGLGAGQLGGIEGANANAALAKLDVYDRIIGLGPDASFAQLVVQLPILTQGSSSGQSDDPAAAALAGSVVQDLVRRLSKINWATIAELLQQVGDWSMDHMLPTPAGDGDGQSGSDAPPTPEMPDISCWPGDDTSVSFSDAGTQAFVFAAALAGVRLDRESAPRKSRRSMLLKR